MKYLVVGLTLLTLFSCNKNSKVFKGKVLNQVSGPIVHFDPQLTTGLASGLQLAKVYESLMESHPYDAPYGVFPNLSDGFPKLSKDGLTYTFSIKKNVYYHPCNCFKEEKRQVVAEDFVNAFKRIADPKLVSPHYNYWRKHILGMTEWYNQNKALDKTDYSIAMEGVKAITPYTLQIKLTKPNNDFLHLVTSPVTAPLPMEAILFYKNDLSSIMIGTGAFIQESYTRKSKISYVKNPNFRNKTFPTTGQPQYQKYLNEYGGKRIPFIDRIEVKIIKESQTQWLNFMKGKLDYLEVPKDNFSEAFNAQNELTPDMLKKGIEVGATPSHSNVYYFGFNLNHPILKNKKIRKAIYLAFDKEKFNKLFFNNTAEIATSLLPPGIKGNSPAYKLPKVLDPLKKAKELLAEAGYPNGQDLPEITITVKNKTISRQVGQYFSQEMKKLGINVRLDAVTWPKLMEKAQKGTYSIFYLAWFVGLPTGLEFYELLYGPNHPNSYNRVGYQNPEFDQLFDQLRSESSAKKQDALTRRMNKIVMEDLPLMPLVHSRDFFIKQGWLKNYVPSEQAGGLEQYYDIDEVKREQLLKTF